MTTDKQFTLAGIYDINDEICSHTNTIIETSYPSGYTGEVDVSRIANQCRAGVNRP